jgi:PPE-repeat protein
LGEEGAKSLGEEGAIWLELAALTLAMAIGFNSRVGSGTLENKQKWNFRKQASGSVPTANGGGERMLLYEMLIAIGIAVVLIVAVIGRLAARVMMGPEDPEEMALLRLARAAAAQRRLVASAAQQERLARAAAAQRRLVAYCLKLQYEDALAAPLPARLATLITQLETQEVSA